MRDRITSLTAILIIIFIAMLLFAGIFAYWQYENYKTQTATYNQAQNSITQNSNTQIADWKTYKNEEYEFEVQYPANWNLWENEPDVKFNIPAKSCVGLSYGSDDIVSSSIMIAGNGNNGCDVVSCPALEQADQIVTKKDIKIDGVTYSADVTSCIHHRRVNISISNRLVSSIQYWVDAIDLTQEKLDTSTIRIEQILSTFKFTSQ